MVDGYELTLADVQEESGFQPNLGGGWGARGPYVTFNQVDQGALIAGGGAALAGAICLIPAVGQVACVAAAAIVAIGAYYLNEYGRCPGDLRVWVLPRQGECV